MERMKVGSGKFEIELFDGKSNFTIWQSTMMDVLTTQELDVALEKEKPKGIKDVEWKSIQKKAASLIRLALAPEVKYNVLNETVPSSIWEKLESIYASRSLTNRLLLKMDLYSLMMDEGVKLHNHLAKFNMLLAQVVNTGEKIGDEEQALLLLRSLPKSYKPLVQTMLAGKTTLNLKDVTTVLLENDRWLEKSNESGNNSATILAVEGSWRGRNHDRRGRGPRSRSKSRPMIDDSERECFYCGEKGHIQYRCEKFKSDLASMKEMMKTKEEANTVVEYEDELLVQEAHDSSRSEIEHVKAKKGVVVKEKNSKINSRWIMDSGASTHMCNNAKCFDTLSKGENLGRVVVGNKTHMNIEGVGRTHLKVQGGGTKILSNMRYVPECVDNVISLGELTSQGYKFIGKNN